MFLRMTNISLLPVLISAISLLSGVKGCTFCPDGPPDPKQVVHTSNSKAITCGTLEYQASRDYYVKTYGCNYFRYHARLCGCEDDGEEDEDEPVCTLCQNGRTFASDEPRWVNGLTCQEVEEEAYFDPFQRGCGYYHFLGSLCGCENAPSEDGCPMCADGSDPLYPTRTTRVAGADSATCRELQEFIEYVSPVGSSECLSSQVTFGEYCGCRDTIDSPRGSCSICVRENEELSNDMAPDFEYLAKNGNTVVHQYGKTCLEAALLANQLAMSEAPEAKEGNSLGVCDTVRGQIAEKCCYESPWSQQSGDSIDGVFVETSTHVDTSSANRIYPACFLTFFEAAATLLAF